MAEPFLRADETTAFIPVYNEQEFLREALESVVGQVDRIVIADNASTDRTEDICRAFQREHPKVEYHRHRTNIGHAANMAFCAGKIETEFALHVGGHDLLPENFVAAMKKNLRETPDAVGAFADVYDFELDGSEGRKDFYGKMLDSAGRTKLVDRFRSPSPLRRASAFFLGAAQGPPFFLIYALFRSEALLSPLARFQPVCACDWLLVFEMLLKGRMVHVPDTHYLRRNNHPVDSPEEYMKRVRSQNSGIDSEGPDRYHPMIESALRLLIEFPDASVPESQRWRLYWELERYFRRHYRFRKKVAETLLNPPPLGFLRHKLITLFRDLRDLQYLCRLAIFRKIFGKGR